MAQGHSASAQAAAAARIALHDIDYEAPSGGSSAVKFEYADVSFDDFVNNPDGVDNPAWTDPLWTLPDGAIILSYFIRVTEAFDDSDGGSLGIANVLSDPTTFLGDSVSGATVRAATHGLVRKTGAAGLGATTLSGGLYVVGGAYDVQVTLDQVAGDGTQGTARVYLWWAEPTAAA